tara:strand:+ start:825 stop:1079 length:255 start_codon:yes stop_codon:yes gene_type:complete
VKYVLVDKGDNIIDTVDLGSEVGLSGAKTFFIGRKQIDRKEFDNMWRVMTKKQYDTQSDLSNRQYKQYEWWREDKEITDDELKL